MRLVHLADLHLGKRQFDRLTPGGLNQREADINATFARVVDQVIALGPDLLLIAGDVFDVVRPSNHTITHAYTQFTKLTDALPHVHVVMIAGNHETPKTADAGCILPLFGTIDRVHVVSGDPQVLRIGSISITCVPERVAHLTALRPDPQSARNILLLHGDVAGTIPGAAAGPTAIERERITSGQWDYGALGHYHVTQSVAPRCWYAGAIEYTSSNPWGEMVAEAEHGYTGKGFLLVDTASGEVARHRIETARRWMDLPLIDGRDLSAESIDAAMAANIEAHDLTGACVRQVVTDVPRDREVAMKFQAPKAALVFQADIRRPNSSRRIGVAPDVRTRRRPNLAELHADKLATHPLPDDLAGEREQFCTLGAEYLRVATEAEEGTV